LYYELLYFHRLTLYTLLIIFIHQNMVPKKYKSQNKHKVKSELTINYCKSSCVLRNGVNKRTWRWWRWRECAASHRFSSRQIIKTAVRLQCLSLYSKLSQTHRRTERLTEMHSVNRKKHSYMYNTTLTRPESPLLAEAERRGPAPASLVPAIHWAFVPYPDNECPETTSSHAAYATTPEQPTSNKWATCCVHIKTMILNYKKFYNKQFMQATNKKLETIVQID